MSVPRHAAPDPEADARDAADAASVPAQLPVHELEAPADPTATGELSAQAIARGAARGFSWGLLGNIVLKFGSFAMSLVLVRILTPENFGTYAIALAATAFVMHINDVGLIAATVQWRGKLEEMAPTATVMAFGFSVIVYGVFFVAAEPFARLAGNGDAAGVVRVLTFTIVLDGITAVRVGALQRRFESDKISLANLAGFVVNFGVTVALAKSGAGAYSYAWGQVIGGVAVAALFLYWGKVPTRFGFDRAVARKLLAFGIPVAITLGVESIVLNADYVIVGNLLGPAILGFYLIAFNVSSWVPGIIGTAVRYVSISGFSRLSEKDPEVLSRGVATTVPLLVTGLIPIAIVLGVLAEPVITLLYGTEWSASAPVLGVLMILTVLRMLTAFGYDILAGFGATRAGVWVNVGWAIALLPALWLGTHWDGMRGTAIAHSVVALVIAIPLTALALRRIGIRLTPVGRGLVRPLAAGAVAIAVCLLLRLVLPGLLPLLIVDSIVTFVVYFALAVPVDQLRAGAAAVLSRVRRRSASASA
jgi:O-antigen/teichoic acid export membrane protein